MNLFSITSLFIFKCLILLFVNAYGQDGTKEFDFFDNLEQQALAINAFENVEFTPPSAFMKILIKIGFPVLNFYIALREKVKDVWFKLKTVFLSKKLYEIKTI